jgi:hypothetical protein
MCAVAGIAIDSSDNIYVSDLGQQAVGRITSAGTVSTSWTVTATSIGGIAGAGIPVYMGRHFTVIYLQ